MKLLRASGAPIWAECPGSTTLSKVADGDISSGLEGDLCHLLASLHLKGMLDLSDSIEQLNQDSNVVALNKTRLLMTEEYRRLALGAAEYCMTLGDVRDSHSEIKLKGGTLPKGVEGTSDFISYDESTKTLHVVDFKFGFGSVEAVGNWQLLVYSNGAMDIFKGMDVEAIHLHIYQPRDYVGEAVKLWKLTRQDWFLLVTELQTRATRAQKGEKCQTGSYCRYCRSRLYCRPFLTLASYYLECCDSNPEDVNLTAEAIGKEYTYLKKAETHIKAARIAFEEKIFTCIFEGNSVPGWQIGRTSGKRYWSGSIEEIHAVATISGLKLTESKPVSVVAAWKNKEFRPLLESLISKGKGSKKLVAYDESKTKEIFKNE